ncbi:tyrosine-type recombinase/integrase [Gaetbulibacter jejuensis]|uniref:Tyrosine-type recombinase/integrase n=1 Tax=Gaetbulibacter jejuensis TaxID=584607 RepID=A0ABP3V6X2_9FLAO
MKHTFFLKKPKSKENTLIFFSCFFKKEGKKFVYSTGEVIHPKYWNKTTKLPYRSGSNAANNASSILMQLNRYTEEFNKIVERYKILEQPLSRNELKNEFNKLFKKDALNVNSFYNSLDQFILEKKKLKEWKPSTAKRYEYLKTQLEKFEEEKKYKLSFNSITESFYTTYLDFCFNDEKHFSNTVARNVGLLKTFLYWAYDKKITYKDDFKSFKSPKKVITRQEALTIDQLTDILEHNCSTKGLEKVRDVFVFQCFTGLRYNELFRINKRTIFKDYIIIKEEKDSLKEERKIPLTKVAKYILNKYDNKLPLISNQKQNKYIKEVLQEMEKYEREVEFTLTRNKEQKTMYKPFYERISTHTARRTFVTLMRNNKVPAKTIMAITGHKDMKTFEAYYSVNDDTTSIAVEDTFKAVELPKLKKA